jgi:hypothetical protein
MSYITDYLENAMLNHLLRNTALSSPTTVYVALFTDSIDDTGSATEVTDAGYSRQAVTFGAPSGGVVANTGAITFTATNEYVAKSMAIMDAATGGNALFARNMTNKTVDSSDSFTIAIGAITVGLD